MMIHRRPGFWQYALLIMAIQTGAEVPACLAEMNLKDRWANRSLALARELASDDKLEKYEREYVRNMTAHLLAVAGYAPRAQTLVEKDGEFSEVMTLQMIASGQAMSDDVEGALKTIEPLSGVAKQRAMGLIISEQARRGDLKDARDLLSRLDASISLKDRDSSVEHVARLHIEQGEMEAARELTQSIEDPDRRAKLEERAKEIGKLLSPEDPGYVEQQIKLALRNELSEEKMRLIRALSSAKAAGAKNELDFARKQIEIAMKLVQNQSLPDRSFNLLHLGQAAEEAGANAEAVKAFRQGINDYLEQKRPLESFSDSHFSYFAPDRWHSFGRAMSADELASLAHKGLAKKDMGNLTASIIASLAAKGEYDRIEELYENLETDHQKWSVAVRFLELVSYAPPAT